MSPSQSETIATTNSHAAGPLGLPRVFWLLWGGMLLNRIGGSVFFLLAVYLTHERGMSPELAGLVVSLYAAGGTIGGPLGGALADRKGRRATLLVGTVCSGVLMLALGAARDTSTIVALAPLLGFFTDLCRPPLQAAVADVVPPEKRTRAYGLLYWAINLGFAIAAAGGGALASYSFGLLFTIDALTTFAFGAIVFFTVPETRPVAPTVSRSHVRALVAPFGDRRFMSFVAIQFLLLLAFTQVIVALPLDMRQHGLGTAPIGWLLGFNGLIIVFVQPLALRFVRGRSEVQWLIAGTLFTGFGLGATAFAGTPSTYALAILLWSLGEIGFFAAAPTLIADLSPVAQRGAYQGTYHLAWGLASMAAPIIGTLVLARAGSQTLWLGCMIVCLVAAGLHLRFTARPVAEKLPNAFEAL